MSLDLIHEGSQQPYTDLIRTVIIVTVSREIALNLIILCKAILITDDLDLCILDCGKGIDYV